jgi:predicted MFS family arabinose efflux permease
VFAAGLVLLGFTTSALVLLLAAGLIGLGYGSLLPGFQTMAIQTTTPERGGHAIATFFIFYDTGIAAGAFVWGMVSADFGFEAMYLLGAVLVVITAIIFNTYLTRKEKGAAYERAYQEVSDTN